MPIHPKRQGEQSVRFLKLLIVLVVMILGVVIAEMNPGTVVLNYGLGTKEVPLSLVLIGAIGLGAVLGMIVSGVLLLRLKYKNAKLQREVGKVQVITHGS
ncbi:MAG TPA: LapA family protein [Sedimenticola sp.]|nr:LapA family protein [Sedimenticola sp.]